MGGGNLCAVSQKLVPIEKHTRDLRRMCKLDSPPMLELDIVNQIDRLSMAKDGTIAATTFDGENERKAKRDARTQS